jgi:hypothetical protein
MTPRHRLAALLSVSALFLTTPAYADLLNGDSASGTAVIEKASDLKTKAQFRDWRRDGSPAVSPVAFGKVRSCIEQCRNFQYSVSLA